MRGESNSLQAHPESNSGSNKQAPAPEAKPNSKLSSNLFGFHQNSAAELSENAEAGQNSSSALAWDKDFYDFNQGPKTDKAPGKVSPSDSTPIGPPPELDFSSDIYGKDAEILKALSAQLKGVDLSKISFTTPAEDANGRTQPDYYLNSEGKLVKNPLAKPNPDGSIKIEVEGNNSARKAEQYANKMQKEGVRYLVELFKRSNPGAKVPEMWQAILDSSPDPGFPNNGDSQNNTTVNREEQEAYQQGKSAPPNLPDGPNPPSIPEGEPGGGAPNSGPSPGMDSGGGGGGGGGGGDGGGAISDIPNQVNGNGGASTNGLEQRSGGVENYDANPANMSETQRKTVDQAEQSIGKAMWGGWPAASANLGCAASVSQILNDAGTASLHNAQDCNVNGVQADLLAQGWKITDTPRPGDVWIGRGGASVGHTGIVGENATLINNQSSSGTMGVDSLASTRAWTNSIYLTPPDSSSGRPSRTA